MARDINITKTRGFKKLMIFLLIGIIFFGLLLFKNVFAGRPFDDNFETYNLGDLQGQGNWVGSPAYQVNNEIAKTGQKSVKIQTTGTASIKKIGEFYPVGEWTSFFYIPLLTSSPHLSVGFYSPAFGDYYPCGGIYSYDTGGGNYEIAIGVEDYEVLGPTPEGVWFSLTVQWLENYTYRAKLNNGNWSRWKNTAPDFWYCTPEYIPNFGFQGFGVSNTAAFVYSFYFDDIGEGEIIPETRIFGIDPVSGTEVSNLDLDITIGYEGFDWDEYDGFTIAFWDERLHASSGVKVYVEDDLEPDGSGEVVVNLTDFGLDKKGKWSLTGLGFGTHLDIMSGMFLTTLGYVDFWSDELVEPEYYFIVVAEELPDLYPISDFEIWYGVNVVEFLEPTSFALAIAGFFQPILEKIGEFHTRTQIYLDTNEAYSRGQGLGDVFPILTGYVANISYFMGGFPLVSWFKYILIVLFAIFIIRTIFKFIPFFG